MFDPPARTVGYCWTDDEGPHCLVNINPLSYSFTRDGVELLAPDGLPFGPSVRGGWAVASIPRPSHVILRHPQYLKTINWRLKDGVRPPPDWPLTLMPGAEELETRRDWYDPVQEVIPARDEILDDIMWLDAVPPGVGWPWFVKLPYWATKLPAVGHLFPGELRDLRDRAANALAEHLGVSGPQDWAMRRDYVRIDSSSGKLNVSVKLRFDPPVTAMVRQSERSRRKVETEQWFNRRWETSFPNVIAADTQALAIAEYERRLAVLLAESDGLKLTPCGHCNGTGIAPGRGTVSPA